MAKDPPISEGKIHNFFSRPSEELPAGIAALRAVCAPKRWFTPGKMEGRIARLAESYLASA